MSHRILVVDDEENIRHLVQSALRFEGMDTASAANGRDAIDLVREYRPDLIVLDVMMPNLDGFEVLRRLRHSGTATPVIFLTARGEFDDRVRGLTEGATDYISKPFSVAELILRIRLRLGDAVPSTTLRCADLEVDTKTMIVRRGDCRVELSKTEFNLLCFLLRNTGRVLSREQILEYVWTPEYRGDRSVVDTYISYLRKKLDRGDPKLIHTVRGVGFCLRAES